ncbi:MAG: alpha/beta hydrolase [Dongiaceae bacterium]
MKSLRTIGLMGLVLLTAACSQAAFGIANLPAYFKGERIANVSYGPEPWRKLDIYLPKDGAKNSDVVVFFHGGRWTSGTKEDYRFAGLALAEKNFLVLIPDYRKYPSVKFPAFMEDGAAAIAWAHEHIAAYGGNPSRIHVAGHSSGAHIGALLAADPAYGVKKFIKSFAGLAGPYDFTPEAPDVIDIFGPPENYPNMQVTNFIKGDEPPMLLIHGQKDDVVELYNLERLEKRIKEKGGQVKVILYPEGTHVNLASALSWAGPDLPVAEDMAGFFREK